MDTQNIKQRIGGGDSTARSDDVVNGKGRRKRVTKRGIVSLALSITVPLAFTVLTIYLFTCGKTYPKKAAEGPKLPFWFPPVWAVHFLGAVSAVLMGLSAWLVWAKGGFHAKPTALYLYLAQFVLALAWGPVVFGAGLSLVGLLVSIGVVGSLMGCYQAFKDVNPLAAQVVKPCLGWTAFLTLVNLALVYV